MSYSTSPSVALALLTPLLLQRRLLRVAESVIVKTKIAMFSLRTKSQRDSSLSFPMLGLRRTAVRAAITAGFIKFRETPQL